MKQLSFFSLPGDEINLPEEIEAALHRGAALALSVSGGKDSDAMTWQLLYEYQRRGWTGEICLIHADLGRAEWHSTPAYVQSLAQRTGLPLYIDRHHLHDLIDHIRARMDKLRADGRLATTPPFPSLGNRYCTSDMKRAPIDRWIRNHFYTGEVVCAMGLRADESKDRAKKPIVELREDCCANKPYRRVWNWNPIHHWSVDDVWASIDTHGDGQSHPAYALGNHRLSCAMCVLADVRDLTNGAIENPDTYRELCQIEVESGWAFKQDWWLGALKPELLTDEQYEWYVARGIIQ